jgi:hypothetical protein
MEGGANESTDETVLILKGKWVGSFLHLNVAKSSDIDNIGKVRSLQPCIV